MSVAFMRSHGGLGLHRFSTSDIPAQDRHEAWVNRDWPSLAPVFRTEPLEPFAVASESLRLGQIFVHYTTITAQRWVRDRDVLRSWAPDALTVVLTLEGEAHGMFGKRAFRTGPGSVQLYDLGQQSSHVSSASRTILVIIPRVVATARGLDVAALHGLVLHAGAAAMLAPNLLSLREAAPALSDEEGALLGGTFLDLLVLALASAGRPGQVAVTGRSASALIARRTIEQRLGSPALTIANLCRELGISRTTLHRLFETDGGVQAYIRGRRLEAVRLALGDPAGVEPIYALAERFGFSDAAHLSRLFRTRYGFTPSDQRARARRG
jgi:AraC-like DNA-binding protein